jgi:hypothetical protein
MYDCLRDVFCTTRSASSITYYWQNVDDIKSTCSTSSRTTTEQRIASDFFSGDGNSAIPCRQSSLGRPHGSKTRSCLQRTGFGERGMDAEGFHGLDGRTSIFDYWCVGQGATEDSSTAVTSPKRSNTYSSVPPDLHIANREKAVSEGDFFDLMYVNPQTWKFNPRYQYAINAQVWPTRCCSSWSTSRPERINTGGVIPEHAFDFLGLPERTGVDRPAHRRADGPRPPQRRPVNMELKPYSGRIYKFSIKMEETPYVLNVHNKDEFATAHTLEHILNQVMGRLFGCERSTQRPYRAQEEQNQLHARTTNPRDQEEKAIDDKVKERGHRRRPPP